MPNFRIDDGDSGVFTESIANGGHRGSSEGGGNTLTSAAFNLYGLNVASLGTEDSGRPVLGITTQEVEVASLILCVCVYFQDNNEWRLSVLRLF